MQCIMRVIKMRYTLKDKIKWDSLQENDPKDNLYHFSYKTALDCNSCNF